MDKKVRIKIVDITGNSAATIESVFNANWGSKRWRIVQIVVIGTKQYLIAEQEY